MKKVILIVLAVLLAAGAVVTGAFFLFKADKKAPPDIRRTPIPQTLDVTSAPTASSVQDTPVQTSGATEKTNDGTAMLFGSTYPAESYRSEEKYTTDDGLETALQRKTFYKNQNGEVVFTSLIEKEKMAVYDADGVLVYFSADDKPQTDYTTEPVHWFYKDGTLACAELCF